MSGDPYDEDAYDQRLVPPEAPPASPYRAYLEASRAPFTALAFTLPLFAVYHFGVWWMRTYESQSWANAAEISIALALGRLGWAGPLLAFVTVVFVFAMRQHGENAPWRLPPAGTFGLMTAESLVFAIPVALLYHVMEALRHGFGAAGSFISGLTAPMPALQAAAGEAAAGEMAGGLSMVGRVALSCGAGVYEEFLFRMLFMGFLAWVLRTVFAARGFGMRLAAALVQATLFAAFHHLPGIQEEFEAGVFAFRLAAGVYFAFLYWERGFGVAAGAHAAYDLLTVVAWP